ncbi:hypothetical protein GW781_01960 [bacterium]|nr:hypothetical protein [bacterium]NCT19901.1 hypothetical protein [bacterium]
MLANLKRFKKSPVTLRARTPFYVAPLPETGREAALLPARYRGMYADHPRLKELLAS